MKNLLFGGARLDSAVGDLGLLILRVFAGLSLLMAHGLGKLPPSASFMKGVQDLGFPAEAAWLSTFAETVGALALVAGFMTRPAALLIAINLSVAGFLRHASDPYARKELPFLFLAVAVMFVLVGAGRYSIDRLLRK
jgi:putative oxidoreductase